MNFMMENNAGQRPEETAVRKRFISICIIGIMACIIFGCANTAEDTSVARQVCTGMFSAIPAESTEQTTDSSVSHEEIEAEEEIEYDYFSTYLPILAEYERAWEDETYTIEDLQNVAGVFIPLTDAKFRLGSKEKDYTLYYSMSDLMGDGIEELIIGIQGEEGIAPCFLYTGNGERIHMTDSRTWSDLVEKPTILYEYGIVESTESIEYGMCRYNFYQLSFVYTSPREVGRKELIDRYFYIEDSENGTRYYKGDIANPVTEEEFWNGIGDYESMPQIKLDWHELEGFWEPDEEIAETFVVGEEYRQSEKEEAGDKAESAVIEAAASNNDEPKDEPETKKEESVTVVTKMTEYYSDGSVGYQHEYEYDSAGREVKRVTYYEDEGIDSWSESKYDSAGNQVKFISHFADGRVSRWVDRKYDSAGNTVMSISYNADGSIDKWYGYEYDRTGNKVKSISILPSGWVGNWYAYEYDSAGNEVKYIRYGSDGRVEHWGAYEYDGAGRLMKETSYTDNTNFYWDEYEYDSAGNKVKEVSYKKSDGDILSWQEWEYDSAGNRVKWIMYEADGSIRYWEEYEYDNAGNETKWIGYYGDGSVGWWRECGYEYDSAGNLAKEIRYDSDGRLEYEYITITPQ